MSTLTAALRAAIAEPPDLEPLRALGHRACVGINSGEPQKSIAAQVIRVAMRDADHLIVIIRDMTGALISSGASTQDLAEIMREASAAPGIPRSSEWVVAALRLAAWADGQATP